jgi:2,4-dienoyl-CoA reductase-like NADH-dependent reductase (Old Yellow Enzyme family)
MQRNDYKLFSKARIGNLTLPNRLVRSATWDPSIIHSRRMTDEVLDLYRELATGGVGLIITGGFPVIEQDMLRTEGSGERACSYDDIHIEGIDRLASVVHRSGTGCKIVAQLEAGYLDAAPSDMGVSPKL